MATDRSNASNDRSRRRGVRFGTKTLLLATALVAFGCYWGVQYAALRAAIRHQELSHARWKANHITLAKLCDAIDARYRAAERVPFVPNHAVLSHKLQTLEELRSRAKAQMEVTTFSLPTPIADRLAPIDVRIDAARRDLAE